MEEAFSLTPCASVAIMVTTQEIRKALQASQAPGARMPRDVRMRVRAENDEGETAALRFNMVERFSRASFLPPKGRDYGVCRLTHAILSRALSVSQHPQ